MAFDKTITLQEDGQTVIFVNVSFAEPPSEPSEFRVQVRRTAGGPLEAEAVWHVHEDNGGFSLQITSQMVNVGICLAGCLSGIASGTGPLVDCLKKAKDRVDVSNCIDAHGYWQVIGALSCIYGCLQIL